MNDLGMAETDKRRRGIALGCVEGLDLFLCESYFHGLR